MMESTDTHNSVRIPGLSSSVARPLAARDSRWPRLGTLSPRPAVVTPVSCFLSAKQPPRGRRVEKVEVALFPPNLHSRAEGRSFTATVTPRTEEERGLLCLWGGGLGSWGAQNQL